MFGILGPIEVGTTVQTYRSFDELFNDIKKRMAHDGYRVVKSRTHRYKSGNTYAENAEVVRCDLVCDRGGQPYKCQATRLKTTTKKTDCPWKAKAVNRKTLGAWVLTIICDEHNHEPRTPEPPSDNEQDAEAEVDAEGDVAVPAAPPASAAAAAAPALEVGGGEPSKLAAQRHSRRANPWLRPRRHNQPRPGCRDGPRFAGGWGVDELA